jgi:hypothetical protein
MVIMMMMMMTRTRTIMNKRDVLITEKLMTE